jgi:hypothetical protein
MDFGIVEIISLLMGLQGFGVTPDPKAPTPDASLQYAIPDADVVGHVDIASLVPGNYKVLMGLPDQPAIKASPDLQKLVKKAINEVEGPRGMAKGMIGLDPVTDLNDATLFLQVVPHHDPNFVAIAHGKFGTATIDKIGKLMNKPTIKVGSAAWVDSGDGPAVGITKDGVLIAGTPLLVKERIADTWKSPPHGPGTNLGYAADVLAQKPVFAFVLTMSQTARTEAMKNMPKTPNFATDIITRHKAASLSVFADGIGWQWADSKAGGLDSMASISEGLVDIFRAAQIAPRGFAKIVLGGLDSYKGASKQVDALLAHKADVLKIVDTYTGDGSFKVKIDKDPKALKLNVRLTGKSLSEVLPLGMVVPMGAVGFLMARGRAAEPMEMNGFPMPTTPAPAPVPKKKP